ncbi:MAG: AbrB/MazE/SpoVT family DNA-binding domain-containing protein [Deltaproteobacteria bacterium]|nr:AbrB/MazE/SpoVT family DNA-binding domain-containing protein [Deltaproteobacteria bacterium]
MLPDTIPVSSLTTAQIGENGQITVPKKYRTALALEGGARVSLLRLGRGLVIIPEQKRFQQLCDRVARTFASHGITPQDLLTTLPETRERVVARHYAEPRAQKPPRKRTSRQSCAVANSNSTSN